MIEMIERYFDKTEDSKRQERQLKEALSALGSIPWMLEEQPTRWKVAVDGGEEIFDTALIDILAYPDPRMPYEVQYAASTAKLKRGQTGTINVTKGKNVKAARVAGGIDVTKLKDGDSLVLVFVCGDRNKPVVIG